jgi:hypothetical protein
VTNFCEHCQGQRFDRARVLRALRRVREELRQKGAAGDADGAIVLALRTVTALEIPHLEVEEESEVVH